MVGVAVLKEHHNKGYGKMIVEHLVNRARELNLESIRLWVDLSNSVAMGLYESIGFYLILEDENVRFYQISL
ncbi:MAG: GNAT family N-acetyltransferase [Bacteroidota bacterium]